MLAVDAAELLNLCIGHGIITGEKDRFCIVWHEAGTEYPEGWYQDGFLDCVSDIMCNDEAVLALAAALEEKGIEFRPSFDVDLFNDLCRISGVREL